MKGTTGGVDRWDAELLSHLRYRAWSRLADLLNLCEKEDRFPETRKPTFENERRSGAPGDGGHSGQAHCCRSRYLPSLGTHTSSTDCAFLCQPFASVSIWWMCRSRFGKHAGVALTGSPWRHLPSGACTWLQQSLRPDGRLLCSAGLEVVGIVW